MQAYPKYGSEKKGLPTTYYLTIADSHIFTHSELERVDLVVLNDTNAMFSGNPLHGMVDGGAIFMQSPYANPSDVWARIPLQHQANDPPQANLRIYYIDMVQIAREVTSIADLEMRMQGIVLLGAFLKLTPYARTSGMSDEQVYAGVETALRKYFGKRGEQVGAGQSHLRQARLQRNAGSAAGTDQRIANRPTAKSTNPETANC